MAVANTIAYNSEILFSIVKSFKIQVVFSKAIDMLVKLEILLYFWNIIYCRKKFCNTGSVFLRALDRLVKLEILLYFVSS